MSASETALGMLARFKGKEGRSRLVEAIARQELVLGNPGIARRFADVAKLHAYAAGEEVYVQGAPGTNSLYLLLGGALDLVAGGRLVARFQDHQAVGEFPMLEPAMAHAVTLRVQQPSVVALVKEKDVRSIAAEHGEVWKNMAAMLARRLHRTTTQLAPSKAPCVFIGHGHSPAWRRVQDFVAGTLKLEVIAFESESRAGQSIVSVLEEMLHRASFAILVLTAEDETSGGDRRARQNVLHEAGLFQGALGFGRAILLVEKGVEPFSNVDGLQYIGFRPGGVERAFAELERVLCREGQIR